MGCRRGIYKTVDAVDMKTGTLIDLLADGVAPVPRHAARRRIAFALIAGLPLSFAVMEGMLGVRHDLWDAMTSPYFWVKLLFPLTIAVAGFLVVERLARPGTHIGAAWWGLVVPVAAIWSLGLGQWLSAPVDGRSALLWGATWQTCPFSILAISAPLLVAAMVALKGLAPTRLALAGAAAGAMSGGAGATIYALHCPELGAPFLAVWYVAGIALATLAGAALGPRLLRW